MPDQPKIALVVAGGTIGMSYSEREGGYAPALGAQDMFRWIDQARLNCSIEVVDWSHQPSCHYTTRMTIDLIQILRKLVEDGFEGIAVTCGTDTMEEMAYLADLLWAYPQPLIFTGAMIPSDHIGTDAILNLNQAVLAAASKVAWGLGVLVCMQDQLFAASEVCKVTNYRRDAFEAPGRGPVGEIVERNVQILRSPKRATPLPEPVVPAKDVEIIWASLGGGEVLLNLLTEEELDGIVLAAFGSGNVNPLWLPPIKNIVRRGIPVVLTSRCQRGQVLPIYSYEGSALRLFKAGVLNGGHLSPLQARLKLAVGIGAGYTGDVLQQYLLR